MRYSSIYTILAMAFMMSCSCDSQTSNQTPEPEPAPQPQPAAPEKSHATDVTSSGERQQAGLPAWVIATLAGLGAAFVAAVAFVVSKRRRVEDDEPIGKHAAPKNK